ncbi:MAG: hypothetical protein HC871_08435 [Rhizobiales bacterium]|nr:hypothetical protein [Hyphomicrobiales bacterium]
MTTKPVIQSGKSDGDDVRSEWQQAYLATAAALGASWCDFMGERFHAYAHAIDEASHCHDLKDLWQVQASFGQATVKAYGDQAGKLGGLMMRTANGASKTTRH